MPVWSALPERRIGTHMGGILSDKQYPMTLVAKCNWYESICQQYLSDSPYCSCDHAVLGDDRISCLNERNKQKTEQRELPSSNLQTYSEALLNSTTCPDSQNLLKPSQCVSGNCNKWISEKTGHPENLTRGSDSANKSSQGESNTKVRCPIVESK